MNKKGFLLLDSLISVFITSVICILCYSIFTSIVNYENGYVNYKENINEDMVTIFSSLGYCEGCVIDESD